MSTVYRKDFTADSAPIKFNFGGNSDGTLTITNGVIPNGVIDCATSINCNQEDSLTTFIKEKVNEALYGEKKVCTGSVTLGGTGKSGWLPETKTKLITERGNVKCLYRDGVSIKASNTIVPDIESIEVIKDRVIKVHFSDNTVEKAVLKGEDVYSYEYGVTICLMKKILSNMTGGNGGSVYNKLVTYAIDQEKARAEWVAEQKQKEKEAKAAAKAYEDRIKASRIRADQRDKEREIEIHKEAYLRAMKEFSAEQIEKFGMELSTAIESTEDTPEIAKEDNAENLIFQ